MARRSDRRARLVAALVVGISGIGWFLPRDAFAFCRTTTCRSEETCGVDEDGCATKGAPLKWASSCISYALNRQGTEMMGWDEARAAIRKAFEAWSEVECEGGGHASITFQERPPVSCGFAEYDKRGTNVNLVLFQDKKWQYRGLDATLAKTTVSFDPISGDIFDADIEVNTAEQKFSVAEIPNASLEDFQTAMTHEVGHFIGLAHSNDPKAVMFATVSPGEVKRKLTQDDVDALCTVYPPGRAAKCDTWPRGGFGARCDPPSVEAGCGVARKPSDAAGSTALAVTACGFAAAIVVRRRRRPCDPAEK